MVAVRRPDAAAARAHARGEAGVRSSARDPAAIDLAEDRERFGALLDELGLRAPAWAIANDVDEAVAVAERIGYPVLVRPSYVLGGRAMRVCYDEESALAGPSSPSTLVDSFVEDAIEIDVDAVSDPGSASRRRRGTARVRIARRSEPASGSVIARQSSRSPRTLG